MKINPAAFQAYNKVAEYGHPARQADPPVEEPALRANHTDQIQISPEGARKMEISQLTRAIMAQSAEPASPQRLEQLRTAIRNGSYRIPTSDLADAVMKHWLLV